MKRILLLILLLIVFCIPSNTFAITAAEYCIDSEEAAFLTLINNYRQSNNLPLLKVTTTLGAAADHHSIDMGVNNYFSHTLFGGITWSTNMSSHGYPTGTYRGENIAAGNSSASLTFDQWKNSATHNANMLGTNYNAIGIGRANIPGSTYVWYWTTTFGNLVDTTTPQTCSSLTPSITPNPTSPLITTTPTLTTASPTQALLTPTRTPTPTPTRAPTLTPTRIPTPTPTSTVINYIRVPYSSDQLSSGTTVNQWKNTLFYAKKTLKLSQIGFYNTGASNRFEIRKSNSSGNILETITSGTLNPTPNTAGYYYQNVSVNLPAGGYYIFRVYPTSGRYYYGSTSSSNFSELSFLKRSSGSSSATTTGAFQIRLRFSL